MVKHKHKWQFVDMNNPVKRVSVEEMYAEYEKYQIALFICDCGKLKKVKVKE